MKKARIQALHEHVILDALEEQVFDDIAKRLVTISHKRTKFCLIIHTSIGSQSLGDI